MDIYQFSLFFAALVIAYILVHIRLVKFETYLKDVATLKLLNERLKDLADRMEHVRVDRVEEGLHQLHDDLQDLGELTKELAQIQKSAPTSDVVVPVVAPTSSPAERIRAVVEERLLNLGYRNLRILTDLSDASLDEEVSVQVECERRHMACKGQVKTINGGISDVEIHTIVQSFP
ncbi:MAG: hypothetical protein ACYST0_04080 [Planctomycetota bacterium]|jgi:hypothetical protein